MDSLVQLHAMILKVRSDSQASTDALDIADAAEQYICDSTQDDRLDIMGMLDEFSQDDLIFTSKVGISALQLPVTKEGIKYPSVMHCFQAQKEEYAMDYGGTTIPETNRLLYQKKKEYSTMELHEANQKGRSIALDTAEWDKNRDTIMYSVLKSAIDQNEDAKKKLLATTSDIREDMLPDNYWGGTGNNMGKLFMKIRDELNTEKQTAASRPKRKVDDP